jgi:hypothetical protein
MSRPSPTPTETAERIEAAIAARLPLRVALETGGRLGSVRTVVTTYTDMPWVTRTTIEEPPKVKRSQWASPHMPGHAYHTAGELAAALRFSVEHPGRVPPGTMTPAELAGEPARRQREMQL